MAAPCENVSLGICGQQRPYQILRRRGMNLNLCILRPLEDTFSIGAAKCWYSTEAPLKGASSEYPQHVFMESASNEYLQYMFTSKNKKMPIFLLKQVLYLKLWPRRIYFT